MREQKVYLKVTNDIYELPIAIGDTPKELSEQTGILQLQFLVQ